MRTISITGASGFIGAHLLRCLLEREDVAIRALSHRAEHRGLPRSPRLKWITGDLAAPQMLEALVATGCDLVHLAYPQGWSHEQHIAATQALADTALSAGVRRIVHCSTAVVVGRTAVRRIDEDTPPEPAPGYEATKLEIERCWFERCRGRAEVAVLRPTAVYGSGGKNLLKLARDLRTGSTLANYLRSSLHGRRRMNLVHVSNVVAALEFLLDREPAGAQETYIISDDEEPANNFRDIERLLMQAWGMPYYALPPAPLPGIGLSLVLRALGRSNAAPDRIYDDSRLRQSGLRKPCTLERGLRDFASWYAREEAAP